MEVIKEQSGTQCGMGCSKCTVSMMVRIPQTLGHCSTWKLKQKSLLPHLAEGSEGAWEVVLWRAVMLWLLLPLHPLSVWSLACIDQRAVGRHVLAPQAPRKRVTLAAGAERSRSGSCLLPGVGLQSGVDEVGAGALKVLGVRAA